MFGDGSQGALNVTSGVTYLPLNTKLQYTTVNVGASGTIRPSGTTGSVLYILATESITINGTINTSNLVNYGNNTWGVTIDGESFTSPGVSEGGAGYRWANNSGGDPINGFGGGGAGHSINYEGAVYKSGDGGNGGGSPSGGGARSVSRSSAGRSGAGGNNGSQSGGGSGSAWVEMGAWPSASVTATGGAGGGSYGASGSSGSGSISNIPSGGAFWIGGGGGGAGGRAGRAGVHVVLKSPTVIINGTINTSGTNGTNGGNGGRNRNHTGWVDSWGFGGGGGGGGSAGKISITYNYSFTNSGTYTQSAGSGGTGGLGGPGNTYRSSSGLSGSSSTISQTKIKPIVDFTSDKTSGVRPLIVSFTNKSSGGDSFLWTFGDGTTSTQENPTKTYSAVGTYTVSLKVTNSVGSSTETKTSYITTTVETFSRSIEGTIKFSGGADRQYLASRSISGTLLFSGGARAVVLRDAEAIQDKRYLYKVYDPDGNYIEVWKDVISDLTFTHEINTIGSSATIELARNSDTVGVSVEPLLTEDDQNLLTEDDLTILGSVESKNQIGSGSSVDYNNRVDVTVFYGAVEPLYTEDMESLLTEDDEELLADIGAPNGRRIFTGFISEINSRYGSSETTVVQLTSYGWDLDQFPITTSDGKTTVPFLSKDPSQIVKDAVDKFMADSSGYGTYTTRDTLSIDTTGTVVSYTFRANTYKDVLEKTLELMPSNWYFRVGLGDNLVYYKQRRATPHHLFYLGKHIKSLDLKGSIINSTNRVLFTGGGEPSLYIDRSEAPADRTRRTLKMMSDNRVTVLDSAEVIADGAIEGSNKRLFRTTVEILTKQYDIESISVGETVGFRNFGSEVDTFTMQILGLTYTPDSVQLQLETKPPTVSKRLQDITRNLLVNENQNIPDAPTT